MKISKLFHWLYAVLMFLPLVMFLPSCLYYSLNKYATNETTTEINYKYQSNEVNTLDDLVEGNLYHLDSLNIYSVNSLANVQFELYYYDSFELDDTSSSPDMDELIWAPYDSKDYNYLYIGISNDLEFIFNFTNGQTYQALYYSFFDGIFENVIFTVYNVEQFKIFCQDKNYLPQYTDYNVIESVETNVQDTISNKMYLAWESIWNLPLFAWTKNSFVSAPFTYITGLFGLSSTNSLNYVFTYFVSISICWLVFDLIMYLPNLAHKWIDKGAIE